MEVIALVGPSGTGKSHRALLVAHNNQADAIIDDGLLIKDGKIIAGKSAKREQNKVLAVKRAIFVLPGHAEEVRKAIEETKPVRILILGTSENMARKIAKALKLPEISHFVHIEEIATQSEMEKARFHRLREGKHIIPVPTIELKPHFSGYLVDPINSFLKKRRGDGDRRRTLGEKSIVRPVFSYYGKLIIDDWALKAIVRKLLVDGENVTKVADVKIKHVYKGDGEVGFEAAGIVIGCDIGNIIESIEMKSCCKNRLCFCKTSEIPEDIEKYLFLARRKYDNNKVAYRSEIKCLDSGEVYKSIAACARQIEGKAGYIQECIAKKRLYKGKCYVRTEDVRKYQWNETEYCRWVHERKLANSRRDYRYLERLDEYGKQKKFM